MTTTLTTEQIEEAQKQEQIIDNGLSSYVEIGFALRKIQDDKLHEGKFIDYAMDRFALKSHTIYRLMRAAGVAKNLIDAGLPSPKNAGQAHRIYELFKDDPAEQINLWKKVIESGVPAALSQIDRFADEGQKFNTTTDEDDSEVVGEVDMDSGHHVEPISIPPSDADPLPCLRRAAQELHAVANAINDGFDELEPLEEEIERIAELLEGIRSKLGVVSFAA
ncbi:MAG: hypothetical protein R3C18_21175 [Planctomycetaceae bacterium]